MYRFLFFFLWVSCSGQNDKMFTVLDEENGAPVERASVFFLYANDTLAIVKSSENGNFLLPPAINFDKISITHINYKAITINSFLLNSDTLYLVKNNYQLEELKINSKKKFKWNPLPFKTNLAHEEKVATLILSDRKTGLKVKRIKAEVIDLFGVKNLKYLPFKLQIREVNAENNLPGIVLFQSEIISKKDSKRWFELDVESLNINLPEKGLYVVFEVLSKEHYPIDFIHSRAGIIVAVPQLKTKRKNNKPYISYRLTKRDNETYTEQ